MNRKRIWIMLIARNREFFRDRSALGWNFLFPFLIILGFGVIFGGETRDIYKIGVFPAKSGKLAIEDFSLDVSMKKMKFVEFVGFPDKGTGMDLLKHHKIDMLIRNSRGRPEYWISSTSPKGYITEQMLRAAIMKADSKEKLVKRSIRGIEIRYIDWLFPGILAMNMMFSALWGVGYIMVRYRKNGVLKRLRATPLTALEYLSAQMMSRLFLLMFTLIIVWIGCDLIFDFRMEGSYLDVILVFFLGGCSLTSIGLLVASRGVSEEFTSGILNFITWPMMFLSEVWFSLEGAPEWVKGISFAFPLTHVNNAVRKIMNDGAVLYDVSFELILLTVITLVCLTLGARLFSWHQ
jgi:ABC-2 type transport system permease protein